MAYFMTRNEQSWEKLGQGNSRPVRHAWKTLVSKGGWLT
jgi:hypothetical protein